MAKLQALVSGMTAAFASLSLLVLTANILADVGLNFTASYYALNFAVISGALLMLWQNKAILLMPSVAIAAWLSYIVSISYGVNIYAVLGISALASIISTLLAVVSKKFFANAVPQIIKITLIGAVGVMLLMLSLNLGHIIINSAWSVTMLGNFAEPLPYFSVSGIIITLTLMALKIKNAVTIGMITTAIVTLIEGFWIIPDAPCLLPEGIDNLAMFTLTAATDKEIFTLAYTGLALIVTLAAINLANLTALKENNNKTLPISLAASGISALLGALPLTVSPLSALLSQKNPRYTMLGAIIILIAALFFEPVIAEIESFPALTIPVLFITGLMLLKNFTIELSKYLKVQELDLAELVAMAALLVVMPLGQNITAGLAIAMVSYVFLSLLAGKKLELTRENYIFSAVSLIYLLGAYI